jgi:hypothetical protein
VQGACANASRTAKHIAAGRVRVARDSIDVSAVREREAEHGALAEQALRRFETVQRYVW